MDGIRFIPIGGIGDVTKNMYLYETPDEILIVDCGIGFVTDEMPGVDLLIPDISYLRKTNKKIAGMVLSHGHEDHIGGLPFILPRLPDFPIYGSSLTAALSNAKLKDFRIPREVRSVDFSQDVQIGGFRISFIRMTHSILDAANLLIKTKNGTFYHGSDFKFDFTPVDGKPSELDKIACAGKDGITCLFSDCVGAERKGHTPSEMKLYESFEEEFRKTKGKIFVTTYSSNISRLNQAIEIGTKMGRKVLFMGRSLLNAREIGRSLGYMNYPSSIEIKPHEVRKYPPSKILILAAGSQAQEYSALSTYCNGRGQRYKD
jgi:ribonuclease J